MSFLFCATELVNNYCVHLCHVFDTSYCYCIFSSVFHAVKSSLHGVSCTETTSPVCPFHSAFSSTSAVSIEMGTKSRIACTSNEVLWVKD